MTTPQQSAKSFFLEIRNIVAIIVGLFIAGVTATVVVQNYLDKRAEDRFYEKSNGLVLEQRVLVIEENLRNQTVKMDTMLDQQNQILIQLGEVKGKLDSHKK